MNDLISIYYLIILYTLPPKKCGEVPSTVICVCARPTTEPRPSLRCLPTPARRPYGACPHAARSESKPRPAWAACSLVGFSQPKPASQQCFPLTKKSASTSPNQHQPQPANRPGRVRALLVRIQFVSSRQYVCVLPGRSIGKHLLSSTSTFRPGTVFLLFCKIFFFL